MQFDAGRVITSHVAVISLRRARDDYVAHYHHERDHQGKGNAVLAPRPEDQIGETTGPINRRKRLGGPLNFYYRRAG